MDQLLKSLNDLHQAASSVCLHLQQLPASLTQVGRSNNPSSASPYALISTRSCSHSRACSQGSGRRIHFAPPFAAINNAFTAQGSGAGGQAAGKGGRSNGKGSSSKQEEEDEERILISEVCSRMLLLYKTACC